MSRSIASGAAFIVLAMSLMHCTAGSVGSPIAEPSSSSGADGGASTCGSKTCNGTQFCDARKTAVCVSIPSSCNGMPSCNCITPIAPGCCVTDLRGNVAVEPTSSCQ